MKKVLIITYYWPPAGGPGVQRWLKLTKYLPGHGVKPFVLTVNPEKATYPLRDDSLVNAVHPEVEVCFSDNREFFGVYKKASGRKEVPFSGFANETDRPGPRQQLARFVRGNFFLPDARKSWNRFAYAEAARLIKEEGINTVITTSPPHSTQLVGLKLKRNLDIHWIADFRDPWTDIYYYHKFHPTALAKNLDKNWERKVLENADEVITVSKDLKRLFLEKSQAIDRERFHIIPNGFDPEDFSETFNNAGQSEFTILYAGTLTDQYPIEAFLNKLKETSLKDQIKLRFIGRRDQKSQKLLDLNARELAIETADYIPKNQLNSELLKSDALLLVIPDIVNNKGILTGKVFDYLGTHKPILAIGPADGDAAELVNSCEAGKVFEYSDFSDLESVLSQWIQDGANFKPNQRNIDNFSREKQALEIEKLVL